VLKNNTIKETKRNKQGDSYDAGWRNHITGTDGGWLYGSKGDENTPYRQC
jgi:hypothetical protein